MAEQMNRKSMSKSGLPAPHHPSDNSHSHSHTHSHTHSHQHSNANSNVNSNSNSDGKSQPTRSQSQTAQQFRSQQHGKDGRHLHHATHSTLSALSTSSQKHSHDGHSTHSTHSSHGNHGSGHGSGSHGSHGSHHSGHSSHSGHSGRSHHSSNHHSSSRHSSGSGSRRRSGSHGNDDEYSRSSTTRSQLRDKLSSKDSDYHSHTSRGSHTSHTSHRDKNEKSDKSDKSDKNDKNDKNSRYSNGHSGHSHRKHDKYDKYDKYEKSRGSTSQKYDSYTDKVRRNSLNTNGHSHSHRHSHISGSSSSVYQNHIPSPTLSGRSGSGIAGVSASVANPTTTPLSSGGPSVLHTSLLNTHNTHNTHGPSSRDYSFHYQLPLMPKSVPNSGVKQGQGQDKTDNNRDKKDRKSSNNVKFRSKRSPTPEEEQYIQEQLKQKQKQQQQQHQHQSRHYYNNKDSDERIVTIIGLIEEDIATYFEKFDQKARKYNFRLFKYDDYCSCPLHQDKIFAIHKELMKQFVNCKTPNKWKTMLFQRLAGVNFRDDKLPDYVPRSTALGRILMYNESLFSSYNLRWLQCKSRERGLHEILNNECHLIDSLDRFDEEYQQVQRAFMESTGGFGSNKQSDIIFFEQMFYQPQRACLRQFNTIYNLFRKLDVDVNKAINNTIGSSRPSLSTITTTKELEAQEFEQEAKAFFGNKYKYCNKDKHKRNGSMTIFDSSSVDITTEDLNLNNSSDDEDENNNGNRKVSIQEQFEKMDEREVARIEQLLEILVRKEMRIRDNLRLDSERDVKEFSEIYNNALEDLKKIHWKKKEIISKEEKEKEKEKDSENNENDNNMTVSLIEKEHKENLSKLQEKYDNVIKTHRRFSLTKVDFKKAAENATSERYGKYKTINSNYTDIFKQQFVNKMQEYEEQFELKSIDLLKEIANYEREMRGFNLPNSRKNKNGKREGEEKGHADDSEKGEKRGSLLLVRRMLESACKFFKANCGDAQPKSQKRELFHVKSECSKYESRMGNMSNEERKKNGELVRNMKNVCDNIDTKLNTTRDTLIEKVALFNKYERMQAFRENRTEDLIKTPFVKCKDVNDISSKDKPDTSMEVKIYVSLNALNDKHSKNDRFVEHYLKISFSQKKIWIYEESSHLDREILCKFEDSYTGVSFPGSRKKFKVDTKHQDDKDVEGYMMRLDCPSRAPSGRMPIMAFILSTDKRELRQYAQNGYRPAAEAKKWHFQRSQSVINVHEAASLNRVNNKNNQNNTKETKDKNVKTRSRRTTTSTNLLSSRR